MRFAAVASSLIVISSSISAQEIIPLPYDDPGEIVWENAEKQYFSEVWKTTVVTNVSAPRMEVFRPQDGLANGTSVIVAPGGGFYALSIESEGDAVARWLAEKGITAFVLKYRLVPTGEDGVRELSDRGERLMDDVEPLIPLAIADGLSAIAYVRKHADRFGLDPARIGLMGFSAGGTVTVGVALRYSPDTRPDFIVPVYPWVSAFADPVVPRDAPPIFIVCASDDALGLARESVELYSAWHGAGISAALHMYARGDHGFGMRKNGLPSDRWIERFHEWLIAEELAEPARESTAARFD